MRTSPCRGCGRPILWVVVDGHRIPLDARAPVYVLGPKTIGDRPGLGELEGEQIAKRTSLAFVSRFATCPKADDFSASRKKALRQPRLLEQLRIDQGIDDC